MSYICTPNMRQRLEDDDEEKVFDLARHSALRKGKWPKEEEQYADALIQEFLSGHLVLSETLSLRGFLAQMLQCHPKRVSKKVESTV